MLNIIENDIKKIIKSVNLRYFKKKKILIFGSSGVIGQYFLILFINLFKNKFSPSKITLITKNKIPFYLDFLKKNKKITIINCNISEFDFTKIKKHDVIIFAGGYGQPSKFLSNSIETINLNTKILIKFISKLKKSGKFLFISSSEIYNGNNKKKITEKDIGSTNTDDPRGSYIEAKRCGEAIINAYNKEFKIDAKSIRLCLAYGPGAKKEDGRVLYQFIERSINKKILSIKDNGLAIRRYIYVADAIRMMLNIILFGRHIVYNVAGKEIITIGSLGKKIAKLLKVPVKFEKKLSLRGSPKNISLSIKRYQSEFGNEKLVNIEQGLKNTVEWYRKLYNKKNSINSKNNQ
jgi:UDP-glucuronate decarboxylase